MYIYVYIYIHTYVHMCVYIYIYICVYRYVHIYVYIYIYIHTHVNTHTNILALNTYRRIIRTPYDPSLSYSRRGRSLPELQRPRLFYVMLLLTCC